MEAILHVPSYTEWLEKQDQREAYQYEKQLLKLLQWQKGGKYWVLKSPHHLEFMSAFEDVFPNSRMLWMHRHPSACIPSFMSMLFYSRRMFSDAVTTENVKGDWLPKLASMLQGGMKYREKHPEKILDVAYSDLLEHEEEVRANVVKHALPSGVSAWPIEKASKSYRSTHRYSMQEWDLSEEELEKRFSVYFDWYKQEFNSTPTP